jgi:hypothetical protein
MSIFLALVRRELVERRGIVWGVVAMVALPLLARFLPGLRPETAREAQGTLALLATFTLPTALALGLGASAVGEDLACGRLGFYFSRPLSAWGLWAAKMAVPALLALGAWAALVPQLSMPSRSASAFSALDEPVLLWSPAVLVALVLLANVASVAYRARDGLFWLDLAALVAVAAASLIVGSRLYEAGAVRTLPRLLVPATVGVTVFAGLAGLLQVVQGRSDVRRGHRVLSSVFWGGVGATVLMSAVFAGWVLAAGPADLGVIFCGGALASSEGATVAFPADGERAGYRPGFLLDTASGRFEAFPLERCSGLGLSADGRRAVWVEGGRPPVLVVGRLGLGGWSRSTSKLPGAVLGASAVSMVGLDRDAQRAVVATPDRIWVVDTDSGAELSSAAVAGAERATFSGSSVRIYAVDSRSVTATLLDLRSEKTRLLARVDGAGWLRDVRDGRALVGRADRGIWLVEEDASVRSLLEVEAGSLVADAGLLSGGRVAAIVRRSPTIPVMPSQLRASPPHRDTLVVWDAPGAEPRRLPLETATWMGAEPREGWVTLGQVLPESERHSSIVDLKSLRVVRTEPGLVPALLKRSWLGPTAPIAPGSPGTRLFVTPDRGLVRLDPETGRREVVLRRSGSSGP